MNKADSYEVGVGIRLLLATLIGLADQEKEVFFLTDSAIRVSESDRQRGPASFWVL